MTPILTRQDRLNERLVIAKQQHDLNRDIGKIESILGPDAIPDQMVLSFMGLSAARAALLTEYLL